MSHMSNLATILDEAERKLNQYENPTGKLAKGVGKQLIADVRAALTVGDEETEPQLVKLVKEIHEAVVTPLIVVEPEQDSDFPDLPVPPTGYGVRVTYADETEDDFDNIESIQVYDKAANNFPFGFMPIEVSDGSTQHRAGFYDEEGVFTLFDSRDQPKPGGGW
jgi:hypothetical protein